MKAQITPKNIIIIFLSCFSRFLLGKCQELIFFFYFLVKIKNSTDIFGSKKCKVTFGFRYILIKKMGAIHISGKAEKEGYPDRTSVLYHIYTYVPN